MCRMCVPKGANEGGGSFIAVIDVTVIDYHARTLKQMRTMLVNLVLVLKKQGLSNHESVVKPQKCSQSTTICS